MFGELWEQTGRLFTYITKYTEIYEQKTLPGISNVSLSIHLQTAQSSMPLAGLDEIAPRGVGLLRGYILTEGRAIHSRLHLTSFSNQNKKNCAHNSNVINVVLRLAKSSFLLGERRLH